MSRPLSNETKHDILIVDDDRASLRALSTLLEKQGYEVRQAIDGPTALMIASEDPPDLVLLDVLMPGMNGFEVCRELKSNAATAEIPVIFCSALGEVVDIAHGFQTGGVDYVTKPYNAAEVEVRVKTHLDLYRLRRELSQRNAERQCEIREHKQAWDALHESEAWLELAVDGSDGGLWRIELDPDDPSCSLPDEVYLSPRLKGFLGYEDHELPNSMAAWESRVLPEDLSRLRRTSRKYRQGQLDRYETEYRIRHKDGSVRWLHTTGRIQRDEDGRPVRFAGMDWDITASKEAEEVLQASQQLVQSTLDALSAHVAILDSNGTILAVNASWRHFAEQNDLGWDDYGVGRNCLEITESACLEPSPGAHEAANGIRQVMAGQSKEFRLEYPCHSPEKERWFVMHVTRFDNSEGVRVVISHDDITERRQAEDALRGSEQRFRALFQGIPVPVYAWQSREEGFVLVDYNDAAAVMTDGEVTRYVGMTAAAMYPNRPDIVEDLARCFAEKTSIRREMTYRFVSTAETKHFVVKYAFVPPDLVLAHTEDVTESVRAEAEASYARDLLQAILDNIPDYVYFRDRDLRFVCVSNSLCDLFHLDLADILGKVDEELFPPEIAKESANHSRHVIETGIPLINKECGGEWIGGQERWVLTTKIPWYAQDGEIIGLIGISRDITSRKRAQNELQQLTRELGERVNELNCIYGISTLIEQPGISLEEILQGTAELIPPAWQYPEIACARIVVDGVEYRSARFREAAWKQESDISVHGERVGSVQVYYLEERPHGDAGPFLSAERELLNAIAERLSRLIERFSAEAASQRRLKEVSALHRVARTMEAVGDLTEALESVAEVVVELLDAQSTLLLVPDDESAERHVHVLAGFERESGPYHAPGVAFYPDEAPFTHQALDRGESMVLPDLGMLFVPLRVRGTAVGVLAVGLDQPGRTFTPEEISLAETIAADVAAALENTRLAKQAQAAAVEAERQRLARELHDSVTQSLYSLTLLSQGWGTMAEQGRLNHPAEAFQRLNQVGQQALREMRLMIHQLRPPILEEEGLAGALRQRLDAVERRANIKVRLLTSEEVVHLPQHIENHLFYIAQEALNNSLRHAAATEVIVRIEVEGNNVLLSVQDDGIGFDPSVDSAGMGLRTMQERAETIGGRMTIISDGERGTTVKVVVALEGDEGV